MNSLRYLLLAAKDELSAIRELVVEQIILLAVICGIFGAVIVLLDPFPPKLITLAVGDNQYHTQIANYSSNYLNDMGAEVEIKRTAGSIENARLLADPKSGIQAALINGGAAPDELAQQVLSLGSIAYEPIWVFYRKDLRNPPKKFNGLASLRVGIGPALTATRPIVEAMLRLSNIDLSQSSHFVTGSFDENVAWLKDGRLDVIVKVAGFFDEGIQKLLRDNELELLNIEESSAYEKRLPFLVRLTLPMDSVDLGKNIPENDISLLATTTTLAVKPGLHPDIQMLLLLAAQDRLRSSKNLFFAKRGELPTYLDPTFPESPVAKRFYGKGEPYLMRHLPFWLAGLIDRVWVFVLAVIALIYPIAKLNVHLRALRYHIKHHHTYEQLLKIEKFITEQDRTLEERQTCLNELAILNRHAISDKVPTGLEESYFALLEAISLVRQKAMKSKFNPEP